MPSCAEMCLVRTAHCVEFVLKCHCLDLKGAFVYVLYICPFVRERIAVLYKKTAVSLWLFRYRNHFEHGWISANKQVTSASLPSRITPGIGLVCCAIAILKFPSYLVSQSSVFHHPLGFTTPLSNPQSPSPPPHPHPHPLDLWPSLGEADSVRDI